MNSLMNTEVLMQRVRELESENAKLRKEKKIELKVSQKGCLQINGIRRFPFTFYVEEIEKIFSMQNEIEEFIEEHKEQLSKIR